MRYRSNVWLLLVMGLLTACAPARPISQSGPPIPRTQPPTETLRLPVTDTPPTTRPIDLPPTPTALGATAPSLPTLTPSHSPTITLTPSPTATLDPAQRAVEPGEFLFLRSLDPGAWILGVKAAGVYAASPAGENVRLIAHYFPPAYHELDVSPSPDGRYLAYVHERGITVLDLSTGRETAVARPTDETDFCGNPTWSFDGQTLSYYRQTRDEDGEFLHQLWQTSMPPGSTPRLLATDLTITLEDGTDLPVFPQRGLPAGGLLLAYPGSAHANDSALFDASAEAAIPLTAPAVDNRHLYVLDLSPDGEHVLFKLSGSGQQGDTHLYRGRLDPGGQVVEVEQVSPDRPRQRDVFDQGAFVPGGDQIVAIRRVEDSPDGLPPFTGHLVLLTPGADDFVRLTTQDSEHLLADDSFAVLDVDTVLVTRSPADAIGGPIEIWRVPLNGGESEPIVQGMFPIRLGP